MLVDVPKDVQQQLAVPDWDVGMAISGYMSRMPEPPRTEQVSAVIDALHQVRACPLLTEPTNRMGYAWL